jgi:hypothetical protein
VWGDSWARASWLTGCNQSGAHGQSRKSGGQEPMDHAAPSVRFFLACSMQDAGC